VGKASGKSVNEEHILQLLRYVYRWI